MIYLAGYSGRKPDELKRVAESADLHIIDIRMNQRSRVPHWNVRELKALIGARYHWCGALGNVNYQGGEIQIFDSGEGMDYVEAVMELHSEDVLLLCACEERNSCHRTVVGKMLFERGHEVQELDWASALTAPQLNN
ncbi:MAG: DUF488 family protein [Chthonomonadales bacterium]